MYSHMLPLHCALESRQASTPWGEPSQHSPFPAAPSPIFPGQCTQHIPWMHCNTNGSPYLGSSTDLCGLQVPVPVVIGYWKVWKWYRFCSSGEVFKVLGLTCIPAVSALQGLCAAFPAAGALPHRALCLLELSTVLWWTHLEPLHSLS